MTALARPAEPAAFDPARVEAFGGRLAEALNGAALAMMASVGHRTGLFDTLAAMPPADVATIAAAAGLNPRYVREWLSAMTTARVVEHDPAAGTFRLPPEHAALLTRGSPNNFAVTMQFIGVLGGVETAIVERFREGGGTAYADYDRFHDVMAEDSGQTVVARLFDAVLPLAPGLTDRLEAGIDVMDAGCGAGRALVRMAERFPRSRFVGYDLCADAVARGRAEATAKGLTNLSFEARDLTHMDADEAFDFVATFDAVHDQKDPGALLDGIFRALRPGGVYLMQDIGGSSVLERNMDHPVGTFLYTISTFHCMAVSLGQGGAGLGTMWGVELAREMLAEAGFRDIRMHRLEHDPINVYAVSRKP